MTEIRTHRTIVQGGLDDLAFLPPGWATKGTPVLVVVGLAEGADIRPLRDVPDGWEWQNAAGDWQTARLFDGEFECAGLVQCRPVQPATERVPWHEAIGRRCETRHGNVATVDHVLRNRNAVTLYSQAGGIIREAIFGPAFDGMVEVLVDGNEAAS
jgi:hypothetical protein